MPELSTSRVIPRRIYQCVADKSRIDDTYADNVARLRAQNPGYTLELFDDDDIVQFLSEEFGSAYVDRFHRIGQGYGAAKADFFRYPLIYRRGGIYLDIKSTADRPFDDILATDDAYLLCQWRNDDRTLPFYKWGVYRDLRVPGGEYQQWHVIAAPGHPYLQAVIARMLEEVDRYTPWRNGYGQPGVVRTTGPVMYTRAIHPIRDRHPHRLVHDETSIGLRYSIFEGVHDHRHTVRERSVHYVTNVRPVIRSDGTRAVAASRYITAREAFRQYGLLPVKRMAKALLRR